MRIGIYASSCSPGTPLSFSCRGEGRWGLNWAHVLREAGYDAQIVSDNFPPDATYDLYLESSFAPRLCVANIPHIHLFYGVPTPQTLELFNCFRAGKCVVGFGYYQDYLVHASVENRGYLGVPLPIPFSDSMLPSPRLPIMERNQITWAAKEIWHRELGERAPYIPRVGIAFLEALADFSQHADFTLNLVQPHEMGSNFAMAPRPALDALARIPNVIRCENPSFLDILSFMSRSKLSLAVSGAMSSSLDAIFCGAVPVMHNTMVFSRTVEADGGCLSNQDITTKEEIQALLERLWLDQDFYNIVHSKYQSAIDAHRVESALPMFRDALQKMGF